jgi:signal transduction histidine kinase
MYFRYIEMRTTRRQAESQNGSVTDSVLTSARRQLHEAVGFARSVEPRAMPSRRAVLADVGLAALVTVASAVAGGLSSSSLAAALVTSVPLAARRRFPLSAFWVIALAVTVTRANITDFTVVAVVIAAYSAVVHSPYRGAALLSLPPAAIAVAYALWNAVPTPAATAASTASRTASLLLVIALATIAIVGFALHSRDRIHQLQAQHDADTRRAVETERARLASELHDVVTHNVSVMIVQAGAARQVLLDAPDKAKLALMAVESSGRTAMIELRHLLGVLSPPSPPGDGTEGNDPSPADRNLRPQPGLGQLRPLIDRVAAAGLPVDIHVDAIPQALPPGVDLAAFRVIQEGLTNVIKHTGKSRTTVRLEYRDNHLVAEVVDDGPAAPRSTTAVLDPHSSGRGLIGLRERLALYGAQLDAGPRPERGWVLRARIPIDLTWAEHPTTTLATASSPAPEAPRQ